MMRIFFYILIMGSFAVSAAAQRQTGRVVDANNYPGADLGAKINAADKALGTQTGEIVVRNGGTISTQVIISANHRLRLYPGTYVTKTSNTPILMKPRSSLIGSGWESIIVESTVPNQYTVISAYNNSVVNGNADSDLVIRDVQIKGANPGFNSAYQAISLGNCSNCTVDKVWVNGTRAIGIQLGGSSSKGHFADNSTVTNCLFTKVASQNLAVVNGRNIVLEGNRFLSPGQRGGPGSTNIDLEPNMPTDRIQNITIRNNFIDARETELDTSGNGILVQASTGTSLVGPILVEQNTIIGGSIQGTITNKISNGIYVFGTTMRDVTIRNNTITRTGQSGIRIEGTRIIVENNKLTDVGGGGIPGFVVIASNSRIVNNTFTYSGQGPADARIVIAASAHGNVYENNRGFDMARDGQEDR